MIGLLAGAMGCSRRQSAWVWDRAACEQLKKKSGFGGVDSRAVEGFVRDLSCKALQLLEEATDMYELPLGPLAACDIEQLLAATLQRPAGPAAGYYGGYDDSDSNGEGSDG
jgi:hypothetical protein